MVAGESPPSIEIGCLKSMKDNVTQYTRKKGNIIQESHVDSDRTISMNNIISREEKTGGESWLKAV